MCISGMYDLEPVRLSARSNYVKFDQTTVATLSPIRHLDRLHAPVIIAYGTCETPEFQRQNREFAAAVESAGKKVQQGKLHRLAPNRGLTNHVTQRFPTMVV